MRVVPQVMPSVRQRAGEASTKSHRNRGTVVGAAKDDLELFSREAAQNAATAIQKVRRGKQQRDSHEPAWATTSAGSQLHGRLKLRQAENLRTNAYLTEPFSQQQLDAVILPFSRFRTSWDVLMLVLVLWTAVVLPFTLGFAVEPDPGVVILEICLDVLFIVDICLNFRTAYVQSSFLVVDRRAIRRNYVRHWLMVDAASSVPWEVIFLVLRAATRRSGGCEGDNGTSAASTDDDECERTVVDAAASLSALKLLKLPKMLRLARGIKILEVVKNWVDSVDGALNFGRIVLLMLLMVLLLHWLCCVWFALGARNGGGWLDDHMEGGVELRDRPTAVQYLYAYAQVLAMMLGDPAPMNDGWEVLFAIFVGLLGSVVSAIVVANVAYLVALVGAESGEHQRKMEGMAKAMARLKLRAPTALRVVKHFEYAWARHRDHEGHQFIESLPPQLRNDVTYVLYGSCLRCCPIFKDVDRRILTALAVSLVPEVYLPTEFILVAGHVCRGMYLVGRGRVLVVMRDRARHHVSREERTQYFCELGLAGGALGTVDAAIDTSARAMSHADVHYLSRDAVEQVLSDYPEPGRQLADRGRRWLTKRVAELAKPKPEQRNGDGGTKRPSLDSIAIEASVNLGKPTRVDVDAGEETMPAADKNAEADATMAVPEPTAANQGAAAQKLSGTGNGHGNEGVAMDGVPSAAVLLRISDAISQLSQAQAAQQQQQREQAEALQRTQQLLHNEVMHLARAVAALSGESLPAAEPRAQEGKSKRTTR